MFHARQHTLFKPLRNLKVKVFDPKLEVSIVPADGDEANFEWTPHYTSDFLGIEGKGLAVKGDGETMSATRLGGQMGDKKKFKFKAPIPHLKMQYQLTTTKYGEEGLGVTHADQ